MNGYFGIISRKCTQSGSNGNWETINGSCKGILSFFLIDTFWFFFFLWIHLKIDIDECLRNNGGCDVNAKCENTIGSYECHCKPGYYGNGVSCSPCGVNEYSLDETTCLSCPENSTSPLASASIIGCKCISFNYYPDDLTSTCLPCSLGFLLDDDSNTCTSNFILI